MKHIDKTLDLKKAMQKSKILGGCSFLVEALSYIGSVNGLGMTTALSVLGASALLYGTAKYGQAYILNKKHITYREVALTEMKRSELLEKTNMTNDERRGKLDEINQIKLYTKKINALNSKSTTIKSAIFLSGM